MQNLIFLCTCFSSELISETIRCRPGAFIPAVQDWVKYPFHSYWELDIHVLKRLEKGQCVSLYINLTKWIDSIVGLYNYIWLCCHQIARLISVVKFTVLFEIVILDITVKETRCPSSKPYLMHIISWKN